MSQAEFKITAEMSAKLKAIAIILMVAHHLFGFTTSNHYLSLLIIHGLPVEILIGRFAKICVAMFMFLSGYGYYQTLNFDKYDLGKNVNKILRFYLHYSLVFLLFIPYGLYTNILNTDADVFFGNLFTVISSYNGAWWFAGTYIQILIFYPVFIYFGRDKAIRIIVISLLLLSVAVLIQLFPNVGLFKYMGFMKNTFIWQVIFFQGYFFAKKSLFNYFTFINKTWIIIITLIVLFCLRNALPLDFSVYKSGQVVLSDFVFAPIFIFCLAFFLREKGGFLLKLSKHSTNIWLTHMFFQYTYFSKFIFYPRISIIVLFVELSCTIVTSICINFILDSLYQLVNPTLKIAK